MKKLILMRHAEAAGTQPGKRDHDRVLTPNGQQQAVAIGNWLRTSGHIPDIALISDAARTQETWQALALSATASVRDDLYLIDAQGLMTAIQQANDCHCLMLLGHNPSLANAMGMISDGNRVSAPPATVSVYTLDIDTWAQTRLRGGVLIARETPETVL